jgi:hypothetical protein
MFTTRVDADLLNDIGAGVRHTCQLTRMIVTRSFRPPMKILTHGHHYFGYLGDIKILTNASITS